MESESPEPESPKPANPRTCEPENQNPRTREPENLESIVINRSRMTNSFEFVVMAGARARQLMRGALPRVESTEKPVKIAQREIVERKVEKLEPERE
jgi:DNA-directed RNA polymerase omega subunit